MPLQADVEAPEGRSFLDGQGPSQLAFEKGSRVLGRKAAEADRPALPPQALFPRRQHEAAVRHGVQQILGRLAPQLGVVQQDEGFPTLKELTRLDASGPEGSVALVERFEEGLQKILRRLLARGEMDDAVRQGAAVDGVGQVAKQRGLADSRRPVDADRQSRPNGGEGGGNVRLTIEKTTDGARTLEDGEGAQPRRWLGSRRREEDDGAMVGVDLDVLVADRNLAADAALDQRFDVRRGERFRHGRMSR